jgi:hypothetical protein
MTPLGIPSRELTCLFPICENIPAWGLDRSLGFQEVKAPEFLDNRHMKVVRLSALGIGRLSPRKDSWYSFLFETESTPGQQCDLPVCSAVPQPTAPPRAPIPFCILLLFRGSTARLKTWTRVLKADPQVLVTLRRAVQGGQTLAKPFYSRAARWMLTNVYTFRWISKPKILRDFFFLK